MSRVAVHKADAAEPVSTQQEVDMIFDRIRQRAFELFEQRGRIPGNDLTDWLNAEREFMFVPSAELIESEKAFDIRVAAPGFKADQIEVTALPTRIIVQGKYEGEKRHENHNVCLCEFVHRDLLRQFELPSKVDPEHIYTTLQDGILKIVAKKAAEVPSKAVPVEPQAEVKAIAASPSAP